METHDTNADGPFSELAHDFLWGFVLNSFLTYPFTMYLFPATWSELSLFTGISLLTGSWVIVTAFLVQPLIIRLESRKKKQNEA